MKNRIVVGRKIPLDRIPSNHVCIDLAVFDLSRGPVLLGTMKPNTVNVILFEIPKRKRK